MIAVIYGVEGQILARMSYSTKFAKNALTHGLSVKNQLCPRPHRGGHMAKR